MGYCDDCYAISDTTKELGLATSVTEEWLTLTGQESNAKKSVVFVSGAPALPVVQLQGVPVPVKGSFKSLGVEVVPEGEKGMGKVLTDRIAKAHHILQRASLLEGGFTLRATLISSLIISAGLFGVAIARTNHKAMMALETAVMNCIWGPSR